MFAGGTDPSGGAGLAADIKSCSALGGHGCICVTAITVQNSGGVESWQAISADTVARQMETTCDDGLPDGVKTGMLGSSSTVEAVADVIKRRLKMVPFVLDPVLVAGSGDGLAEQRLETPIKKHLIPLAALVTPNLDEAEVFTGRTVRNRRAMELAAVEIRKMGAGSVLLKGGHLQGEPADVLATEHGITWFPGSRIVPGKVHGTGCTLASSCATLLAAGYTPENAVGNALTYLRGAIAGSFRRKHGTLQGHFPPMGPVPNSTDGSAFYRTPRFCPACGGELVHAEPHPVCSGCRLVFYRNPLPAVVLLLQKNNKVLLARRAAAPAKGQMGLPGGFVDLGEHPEAAAARELKEETALENASFELIGADADHTDYGSVVLYIYRVTGWSGVMKASDDVSELVWTEIDSVKKLAFPAHNRIVARVRKKGRSNGNC
jgi:hydroxymethylpyrimidine/phosphomethylpyrimidine kinase